MQYNVLGVINWSLILDSPVVLIALLALAISCWNAASAKSSVRIAQRSTDIAQRSADTAQLAGLKQYILQEYLDRDGACGEKIDIEGELMQLRRAKTIAKNAYIRDKTTWNELSRWPPSGPYRWQNKVAFEVALGLERIGAATLVGLAPPRLLLAMAADVVIDDWLISQSWIKSYRESEKAISQVSTTGSSNMHYHRRHGECIALVAAAWMAKCWSYKLGEVVIREVGGLQNLNERVQQLLNADGELIPAHVREEIAHLMGGNKRAK